MKSVKILLVEDTPADVRLIREAMKESPLRVELMTARDGVEAVEHLRNALQS